MTPRTRAALDLETHWTQERPELKFSKGEYLKHKDVSIYIYIFV
jgi:hypothetical protein